MSSDTEKSVREAQSLLIGDLEKKVAALNAKVEKQKEASASLQEKYVSLVRKCNEYERTLRVATALPTEAEMTLLGDSSSDSDDEGDEEEGEPKKTKKKGVPVVKKKFRKCL